MNLGTIVKSSFIVSLIGTLLGAYLKIIHSKGAETLLFIGIIATLVFVVSAIFEVRTSRRIEHREKTMWTIAFILCGGMAGLVYFFIGRKRIAANY